jgi:hypothetical protein
MKLTIPADPRKGIEGTISASGSMITKHPQEDLCVGFDAKNPVDSESPKAPFQGKIVSVRVSLED